MIVKSKSRKVSNFDQLFDYMNKGAEQHQGVHIFSRNIYSYQREQVLQEFMDNSLLFKKRKNSVYMYHEIISVTRTKDVTIKKQQEALFQIVQEYVETRAKHNLVYGCMHNDADNNIHYHLMISSNERGSNKNLRLTKQEFDEAKKHLENWTNKHYPELKQGLVINKQAGKKTSQKGAELKRRSGKMPERERVFQTLNTLFSSSKNKQDFFQTLSEQNLEIYTRGKAIGFRDITTGRKYRIKTLGLESQFEEMRKRIGLSEQSAKDEIHQTEHVSQSNKSRIKTTEKEMNAKNTLQKNRMDHNKANSNDKKQY